MERRGQIRKLAVTNVHNKRLLSYNNVEDSAVSLFVHTTCRYSFKKQGTEDFWALAQSGKVMEPVIPCQDGQRELSDIMLTMEKYSMLKTQTRVKKSKVKFHELSLQLI